MNDVEVIDLSKDMEANTHKEEIVNECYRQKRAEIDKARQETQNEIDSCLGIYKIKVCSPQVAGDDNAQTSTEGNQYDRPDLEPIPEIASVS